MRAAQAIREMGAQALSTRDAVAGVQAAALVIQRHQAMRTSGDINTTPEARGCISFEGTTAGIEKEIGKMGSVTDEKCRVEDCVLERGEWLGNVQTFVVRAKDKKGAPVRGLVLEARVVKAGGGRAAAAAGDCVAVGVRDMGDGSYRMEVEDWPDTAVRKQMEVMLSGRHVRHSPMDLETEAQSRAREEHLFGKSAAQPLQQMHQYPAPYFPQGPAAHPYPYGQYPPAPYGAMAPVAHPYPPAPYGAMAPVAHPYPPAPYGAMAPVAHPYPYGQYPPAPYGAMAPVAHPYPYGQYPPAQYGAMPPVQKPIYGGPQIPSHDIITIYKDANPDYSKIQRMGIFLVSKYPPLQYEVARDAHSFLKHLHDTHAHAMSEKVKEQIDSMVAIYGTMARAYMFPDNGSVQVDIRAMPADQEAARITYSSWDGKFSPRQVQDIIKIPTMVNLGGATKAFLHHLGHDKTDPLYTQVRDETDKSSLTKQLYNMVMRVDDGLYYTSLDTGRPRAPSVETTPNAKRSRQFHSSSTDAHNPLSGAPSSTTPLQGEGQQEDEEEEEEQSSEEERDDEEDDKEDEEEDDV